MIQTRIFGQHEGHDIVEATLQSDLAEVCILNYGCVIRDWRVMTDNGPISVVLGLEEFAQYPKHSQNFGIIAGRVANRTNRGKFHLNGTDYQLPINDGLNHLHGGMIGLGGRVWNMETDSTNNAVTLTYHSEDGEEGYPAAIDFTVTFQLQGTCLTCEMSGMPDAPTPINLAQHNYYNLNGHGHVRDHIIQLAANAYTPVDDTQIPTGETLSVASTRFDFTTATSSADNDPKHEGVDHNIVLNASRDITKPSATVYSPQSGLELKLWTKEPGIQMYNASAMNLPVSGLNGQKYGPFAGFCLEAQHFPDSLNRSEWPSIISTPESPYYQKLVVDIAQR